jgi:hypothetical protein
VELRGNFTLPLKGVDDFFVSSFLGDRKCDKVNRFFFQNLLPLLPVLFQPEFLVANDSGTLLIVAGSSGILVMELPARYPPYGAFENNKDVVYCRYGFPELYRERQPTQSTFYFYPTSSRTTWTNSILLNRLVMIATTHEPLHASRIRYFFCEYISLFSMSELIFYIFFCTKRPQIDQL